MLDFRDHTDDKEKKNTKLGVFSYYIFTVVSTP